MGEIQRQGIANAIVNYLGIAIGFVSLLIVQPSFLTKEELGLTRILFSFSALIATFLPLGIGNITTRFFPFFNNSDNRHHGFMGFMVLFPLIGFLLIGLVIWLMRSTIIGWYEADSALFADYFGYVFPFMLILGLISVFNTYCNALYRSTFPSVINDIVVRALIIGVILFYYFGSITLDAFINLYIAVHAIQLLGLIVYVYKIDNPGLRIDVGHLKKQNPVRMIRYGLSLSLAALAALGLKYIDIIMIGMFPPVHSAYTALELAGIYAIAAFIPTIIEAPLSALDKITSAKIGAAWAAGRVEEISEIYHKSARYLGTLGGLLLVGININITPLMTFLPEGYDAGIIVVNIISIATFINMLTGVNDSIIFYSKKYRQGTYLLVMLLVVAIVSNIMLIPKYGIMGAAIATAIASILYNTVKFFMIWNAFHLQPFDNRMVKILMVIAVSFGVNLLLPAFSSALLEIICRTLLTTVVYGFLIYKHKVVSEYHHLLPFGNLR